MSSITPVDPTVDTSVSVSAAPVSTKENEHKEALSAAEYAYAYSVAQQISLDPRFVGQVTLPIFSTNEGIEEVGEKVIDIKQLPGKFRNDVNTVANSAVDVASAQAAINLLTDPNFK